MKALTLTQPWATLVALGQKTIETRSWYTPYRGPLAIHAAKGYPNHAAAFTDELQHISAEEYGFELPLLLPFGEVVATCNLIDCIPTARRSELAIYLSAQERDFGDFTHGRYAWILNAILPLPRPILARGQLGLWEWDDAVLIATARRELAQMGLGL